MPLQQERADKQQCASCEKEKRHKRHTNKWTTDQVQPQCNSSEESSFSRLGFSRISDNCNVDMNEDFCV